MHPFATSTNCFVCEHKFALLRRPCHCRNCGVCICSKCSTQWPARMVPGTYNIKSESNVNVCGPCDYLSNAFREALLEGNHDRAFALHATGNVNLRSPFCCLKGEEFYPVHCAAMGGNTTSLRWLIEYHHCPITSFIAKKKRRAGRDSSGGGGGGIGENRPLLTSKGRSVLDIAVSRQHVDMLRYLVVERGVSILGIKDLHTALLTLNTVLHRLPPNTSSEGEGGGDGEGMRRSPHDLEAGVSINVSHGTTSSFAVFGNVDVSSAATAAVTATATASASMDGNYRGGIEMASARHTISPDAFSANDAALFHLAEDTPHLTSTEDSEEKRPADEDECIICFEREINCVATPCGHQICCLECSSGLSDCPVCKSESVFIRFFKP